MFKRYASYILVSALSLVFILGAVIFYQSQFGNNLSSGQSSDDPSVKLGFSYLPINQTVSSYYGLGVDSGALVTEVTRGSLADRAGIRPGDVVTCFNGATVGGGNSLLGMMRSCSVSNGLNVEFSYNGCCRLVTIWDSTISYK